MVILIRCNDIVSDPRVMKYVGYLRENEILFHRMILCITIQKLDIMLAVLKPHGIA